MTDHSDPMPDEDDLLAVSALLDGTASAEEAARVESDPALRALFDELRDLRSAIADVPAAPLAVRDDAVAGALAVFDELYAGSAEADGTAAARTARPAAATGNVVRFERRRRWYGIMTGAAAAAVAVLFVGALVTGGLGGGDDEESATFSDEAAKIDARTTTDETMAGAPAVGAPEAATEMAVEEDVGVFGSDTAADTENGENGENGEGAAGGSDVTEAPAATEAAAETTAAGDGSLDAINSPASVVAINTPEQLRDYARSGQAVLPLPGLGLPCVDDGMEAIGEVTYQGVLAIVVRDPGTGTVTAYDTQDACAVLVTVEP